MDNNSNKSGSNFFSGFLLGVLVGAAVVFLLGTKKGKKILKAISEEGAENISNILKRVDETVDLDDMNDEEQPSIAQSSPRREWLRRSSRPASNVSEDPIDKNKIAEDKPKTKRFFRGISRHVN